MKKPKKSVWHPIKTMPRDGRFVLTTNGERCLVVNHPENCVMGHWTCWEGKWAGFGDAFWNPTHWTELPPLP